MLPGIKRCYVDAVLKVPCPYCGGDVECDLSGNYLSYPEVGVTQQLDLCCCDCEEDAMDRDERDVEYEFSIPFKIADNRIVILGSSGTIGCIGMSRLFCRKSRFFVNKEEK